jgi:NodT family efflux transporter outer membrane factor (OMF) lipoprotein
MWKVAAAAGLSLMLVGCAVGPKYQRPAAPAPPAYKESPQGNEQWKAATPSEGVLRANWWEMFGDPQLDKLELMVAAANQNLKQAEAQFRQARAFVALNRANYYPTVTVQPSITASRTPGTVSGRGAAGTSGFYSLPFGASWEPNFWGHLSLALENAVAGAQASAADLENVKLILQAELAADYFQMAGLDMEASLLNDTLAGYERALQLTINRFNGGVASKADVAQAQTQLASTRAQLTDLGVARSQLEHAIAVLTGQPPSTFSLPPGRIQGPPPPIPPGLPSELLERRPDIASSERLVAAANAEIGLAKVAYYPTVLLDATGGLESGKITTWLSWPARFFSVGPSVAETLLDFGRRRAQMQQVMAAYDATVASYRQTVLTAFQEVEDNLAALRILEREASQQDEAVKGAQESLRLEMDRYKAGTVSYLDVITTQTIALNNEIGAVGILSRRMNAAVQLIRALGGGWNASSLPTAESMRSAATAKPQP